MLPKAFEIHVRGAIAAEALDEFEYLTASTVPSETVLSGVLPDQSALFGVLNRLQSLGLELVEVRRLGEDGDLHRPLPVDRSEGLGPSQP